MGAKQREYRRRSRAIANIRKTTKAMEMISASRIQKARRAVEASTPYASEITRAVAAVATRSTTQHPLTDAHPNPTRAAVLLITSDRGQAGAYNANAMKSADALTAKLVAEGKTVDTYIVGRKGVGNFKFKNKPFVNSWTGFSDRPAFSDAKEVAAALVAAFTGADGVAGSVDEVHVVFTEFVSMLTQNAVQRQVLPLQLQDAADETGLPVGGGSEAGANPAEEAVTARKSELYPLYDFEPSAEGVLDALLPRYVEARVFNALLQSAASEHAARRRAMKSATDNATDLIRVYTRLANSARQAEITQEISEIVGGASALADATAGSD
ncbi:F0F1 ATP synthase subunit gamma [Mangrovactinospora gilvigrisea]|uniref:ATP synthase gamma chain n=1 Tax=Mangrovactinospora gilvigrisea TaxID=1428644 RepID=A0A1J7BE03_9ACTN|nr:F0F1 ATP synthase subunit gamma [Mangrovactinospora gilvigrisea]OIV36813.1 F0F1 ATP synthase subunit gamma [Mangrovactinospora gilvigrisea]